MVDMNLRKGSLEGIVRLYTDKHWPNLEKLLLFYQNLPSLKEAIYKAAFAIRGPNGRRHGHQTRIKKRALEEAASILGQMEGEIRSCKDFEGLIHLIKNTVEPIPGLGELYTYDTALRIGAKLGLRPNLVYIHAGTRDGAKALGINPKRESIDPANLPVAFQELEAHQIEDCLCIHKDRLKELR
ncbi:MAG: hypothetical protein HYX86_01925 [Chloroflexi bacterium]|nr:hypothetical protein [Chloroflexota bacterium]